MSEYLVMPTLPYSYDKPEHFAYSTKDFKSETKRKYVGRDDTTLDL